MIYESIKYVYTVNLYTSRTYQCPFLYYIPYVMLHMIIIYFPISPYIFFTQPTVFLTIVCAIFRRSFRSSLTPFPSNFLYRIYDLLAMSSTRLAYALNGCLPCFLLSICLSLSLSLLPLVYPVICFLFCIPRQTICVLSSRVFSGRRQIVIHEIRKNVT